MFKIKNIPKDASYIGAAVGLVLFALFGLLPGTFTGGVVGLNIAQKILGAPVTPTMGTKIIFTVTVAISVMITGFLFIVSASILGWVIGCLIETLMGEKSS